jgi:DNA-directed RNA polymerase subunit RPC12/RpoP
MAKIVYRCPICDTAPKCVDSHIGITWQMECPKCGLQGPEINSQYEAASRWNELVLDWK